MAGVQLDLEAIVREVLRRLENEPAVANAPARPAIAHRATRVKSSLRLPASNSRPAACPATLQIRQRVVTLAAVQDRLAGIRRLLVPPGAVVTPAVRDELRQRKIEIQVASPPEHSAGPASATLLLAVETPAPRAMLDAIADEAGCVQQLESGGLAELVARLADAMRDQRLPAVLVTAEPAAALCLANRQSRIRAAWGTGPDAVRKASESIGANVLVLDTAAPAGAALRTMIRQFLQASHDCPPRWKAVLEKQA
jgi:hypothetical protein